MDTFIIHVSKCSRALTIIKVSKHFQTFTLPPRCFHFEYLTSMPMAPFTRCLHYPISFRCSANVVRLARRVGRHVHAAHAVHVGQCRSDGRHGWPYDARKDREQHADRYRRTHTAWRGRTHAALHDSRPNLIR